MLSNDDNEGMAKYSFLWLALDILAEGTRELTGI